MRYVKKNFFVLVKINKIHQCPGEQSRQVLQLVFYYIIPGLQNLERKNNLLLTSLLMLIVLQIMLEPSVPCCDAELQIKHYLLVVELRICFVR